MSNPLDGLNEKQREAAETLEGPVLILAGAGSGKTRTLTHRIANLLAQNIANKSEVMAVTFTNKAAREMKERLAVLLGGAEHLPIAIGTFHSLGARMLREQHNQINRSPSFTILDTQDGERMVKQIMLALNINPKQWTPKSIRGVISRAKNDGLSPEQLLTQRNGQLIEVAAQVYGKYSAQLQKQDCFDFDDLILEPLKLLRDNEKVRQLYQQRWRYLSVDEYQDTNQVQDELLRLLLSQDQNLCAVGDDYQAIYSWRGARVDHILRFEEHFPGCKIIYLTQNYRSTGAILKAANEVIKENQEQKHKELWTEAKNGEAVQVINLPSDKQEAAWVRQQIKAHLTEGGRPTDIAILYRTNAQSRLFEEEFVRHSVPYVIVGGVKFYDRAEIKDALALLHLAVNPNAALAFQRLAKNFMSGIGPKTVAKIMNAAQNNSLSIMAAATIPGVLSDRQITSMQPLQRALRIASQPYANVKEVLEKLLLTSGYLTYLNRQPDNEERAENIDQLLNVASQHADITAFMEEVALLTDLDATESNKSDSQDKVTCMTLHAAKGLEFKHVYLVGCEEDLLPHANSVDSQANLEEERRLLYVGMTRARQKLVLTWAQQRALHGELLWKQPSRFLTALPETVERWDTDNETPSYINITTQDESEPTYAIYEVGDQFHHPVFGAGIVVEAQNSIITCVFEGYGIRQVDAGISQPS